MKKQHLCISILIVIAIILIGGVFVVWQKKANQELVQSQNQILEPSENQPQSTDNNTGVQSEPEYILSPQHIVAIPGSRQVWYEVPEMGIKLLVSKPVAEDMVYSYRTSDGSCFLVNIVTGGCEESEKELGNVYFYSKTILAYNKECGSSLCGTDETVYYVGKVPGVYHQEELTFGSKFIKQFKDFYLITGGSTQGGAFANEEEEKRFYETVEKTLPTYPRQTRIRIESL